LVENNQTVGYLSQAAGESKAVTAPTPSRPGPGLRSPAPGYLAVAAAATLWGVAGAVAKRLFQGEVDALLLVDFRMTLAFLVLLLWLGCTRPALVRLPRREWGPVALWGLGGMAAVQFTYLYAIETTNVATAIFLQYLAPLLTALYVRVVRRQPLSPALLLALTLALAGSGLLVLGGREGLRLSPLGVLSGLGSAVALSFYTLHGSQLVERLNSWTVLLWGLGIGSLLWHLILPPWQALAQVRSPWLWGYFLYIAVLATVVPFGLYLWGLRSLPPTPAVIMGTLEPVVGAAAAWVLVGEALTPVQILGALAVLAGVTAAQLGNAAAQG